MLEHPVETTLSPPGWLAAPQAVLAALLVGEVVVFSAISTNFLTLGNAFEIVRLCVEIGLLAIALTPVIFSPDRGEVPSDGRTPTASTVAHAHGAGARGGSGAPAGCRNRSVVEKW